ncbi:TonB-dependent vitamin B12 receptor [Dyella jiangningensis]|uniref:TonB-dependent vitamin B12 receptor n=1 Tax=Dyella jiangningensis TaxID=1379159 RepID=UPI002410523D|nr:TonB-dependent vitamin B12 receptor [Dyella jiangningensis]MDG2538040.1 TonB-dependent vitamin B12 receptor [Dyella jiangningensis]
MAIHPIWVRRSILATALLVVLSPAFADEAADLNGVVVTATRTSQTQDQTLSAVTVIDRSDIERLQPASLADLLRGTPGMALSNNGGLGKATSAFLRGTESDHVLVLVDGIKIGSATLGNAALQDIPVEQIERIEIVRGPFSSLYGSEAIGGVIQIFTRRPEGAFVPSFTLGVGSYSHLAGSAGLGGKVGDGWYALEASHDQTHGINACRVGAAEAGAACFADQPDKDGYRNTAVTLQAGYRFSEQWDADARLFRSEGHNWYDGNYSDSDESATQVVGGRVHYRPTKDVTVTVSAGTSGDFSKDFLHGVYTDRFDTHRDVGSLQADIGVWSGLLTGGFDWQRDEVDSSTAYAVDSRINRGLFAQWQQTFGRQSVQASVRRDDNSQFGGKNTGSLLWGWDFTSTLRVTASYGTAFKAPTFNELYYPGYGNADLRPEKSQNIELGLRGNYGWGYWSLNAFRNNVSDLITYDASIGLPGNVEKARIRGAEGVVSGRVGDWLVTTTATWLDPRDKSTNYDGNLLPRRARQMARVDVDRGFGDLTFGGSWYVSGRRYDDLANRHALGGYAITDLRVAYALTRDLKVQLALNNAFGKGYETAWYYNQPGRNTMLTLRYQPAP